MIERLEFAKLANDRLGRAGNGIDLQPVNGVSRLVGERVGMALEPRGKHFVSADVERFPALAAVV